MEMTEEQKEALIAAKEKGIRDVVKLVAKWGVTSIEVQKEIGISSERLRGAAEIMGISFKKARARKPKRNGVSHYTAVAALLTEAEKASAQNKKNVYLYYCQAAMRMVKDGRLVPAHKIAAE